jgi:hypothetical protein
MDTDEAQTSKPLKTRVHSMFTWSSVDNFTWSTGWSEYGHHQVNHLFSTCYKVVPNVTSRPIGFREETDLNTVKNCFLGKAPYS